MIACGNYIQKKNCKKNKFNVTIIFIMRNKK